MDPPRHRKRVARTIAWRMTSVHLALVWRLPGEVFRVISSEPFYYYFFFGAFFWGGGQLSFEEVIFIIFGGEN